MIHQADILIAVYDGKSGGTKNTVLMAHNKGIEIRILSPLLSPNPLKEYKILPIKESPQEPKLF